jgi:hypothetical protein
VETVSDIVGAERTSRPFKFRLRRRLLGIDPAEATFERRGFHNGQPDVRLRLERVGYVFLDGYHAALEAGVGDALEQRLNSIDSEWRGFAFEGAAMALSLQDALLPARKNRFHHFLSGAGDAHAYMMHVGAGWAMARLPFARARLVAQMDSLLRWLAYDGWGFHHGYFHWRRYVTRHAMPRQLRGYERRAFDQGLGRSLWFIEGADPNRIRAVVKDFPAERHQDLWSGVGLACAYAGGVTSDLIEDLAELAGTTRPHVAQGVAFAAQARHRAGNPAVCTELAANILCGMSAQRAAMLTTEALDGLPADEANSNVPAYEIWRTRIREMLTKADLSVT